MSDSKSVPTVRKGRSLGRKLLYAGGGLVALVGMLYFTVTSAAFFKGFILPKVSAALNARVTVADAVIRPFSHVRLRDLKVQTTGPDPLISAQEARAHFSLWDLLGGNLKVAEVSLSSPSVAIIHHADGTSNLDPLLASFKSQKPSPAQTSTKPVQVDLKSLTLKNATVTFTKHGAAGHRWVAELNGLNVTADGIKNSQLARLVLDAKVKFVSTTWTNTDELSATVKSSFHADLDASLMPKTFKGDTELAVGPATGAFKETAQLQARLAADLSFTEINQLALNFARHGAPLGAITASGPCDLRKQEGKLKLEITGIDKRVLNLAGAALGIDFGPTTLNSSNQVELAKGGKRISVLGQMAGRSISLTQKGQTTPPLDLLVSYHVSLDQEARTAQVQSFTLNGAQNHRPLLAGSLSQPMTLNWGGTDNAVDESALDLAVTDLNLADWRNFMGDHPPAGILSATLKLLSQQAGKKLTLDMSAQITGLSAQIGSNKLEQADATLTVRGQLEEFSRLNLSEYHFKLDQKRQLVASVRGAGRYHTKSQDADLDAKVEGSLANLASLLPASDLMATAGTVKFNGRVTQKNQTPGQTANPRLDQTVAGSLQLENFTGQYAAYRFDRLETVADLDVAVKHQLAEIRRFNGSVRQSGQDGGRFEVSGRFDVKKKAGQFALKLTDLNQNALRPFLAGALGDKTLTLVSINANTTGQYDEKGESAVQGEVQIANLLITDPKGQLPKVPLSAEVKLDAGLRNDVVDLRQFIGNIRQGQQAGGSFDVKGSYDRKKDAGQVALKLTDLNQNALRPFAASALGDKSLRSVSIHANATARYDSKSDSSLKAEVQVANLIVDDPSGKLPKTPLSIGLKTDSSLAKQILEVRQMQLALAPTPRAQNVLQLTGKVDLTRSNAITGNLKLAADTLDLTSYYDLFAGGPKADPKPSAPTPRTPPQTRSTANPNEEPAAINLPLRQFALDASIGRLYLRELDLANFTAATKIDGGKINLTPFKLTLNGAPINGTLALDLGVAGFSYDLQFTGDKLPLGPIVNTFVPADHGKYEGNLLLNAQIKGAGTTGVSLQKNLSGKVDFTFTNANVQVLGKKAQTLLIPVAIALNVPELTHSPLSWVKGSTLLGNGKIDVQHYTVMSEAFYADAHGAIPIDRVLTNSPLDLPVNFSLRRSLAEKARLMPAEVATNAAYVPLPRFVKLTGTLGDPKTEVNKLAIAGLLLRSTGGGIVGGKTGSLLQGIGGILSGQTPAGQAPPTGPRNTNAPPDNSQQITPADLLNNLFKKRK